MSSAPYYPSLWSLNRGKPLPKSTRDAPPNPNRSTEMTTEEFIQAKERIVSLDTRSLWAILRSTNAMTEKFANELTWAKAELRRRGQSVA